MNQRVGRSDWKRKGRSFSSESEVDLRGRSRRGFPAGSRGEVGTNVDPGLGMEMVDRDRGMKKLEFAHGSLSGAIADIEADIEAEAEAAGGKEKRRARKERRGWKKQELSRCGLLGANFWADPQLWRALARIILVPPPTSHLSPPTRPASGAPNTPLALL